MRRPVSNCILRSFLPLALLSATQAHATPITLTFTGLQNLEYVGNFYNGGTGSLGSSGTNYGVAFTTGSLALLGAQEGGSGNTANIPPPATDTVVFFLDGGTNTMNVAAGFSTGLAFAFADSENTGAVSVFSGLDGTGTLLATAVLAPTGAYCDPLETAASEGWARLCRRPE